MRKFTLIFSLLLAMFTTTKAVNDPAVMDVNTSTVYTIQFNNGGSYVYCNNGEIYYEGTHNVANAENANYQFKFIEATTDAQGRKLYYIASVGADGFFAYNENTTNAGGAAGSVGLTNDATTKANKGVWYVFNDGNFQYIVPAWKEGDSYTRGGCCWNKWSSSNNNLGMWGRGTSDPNYAGDNQLLIVDINAEVEQEVVVSALADFNPNKYYTVITPSRGGWSVNNAGDKFCSTNDNGFGINVDKTKRQNQFAVLSADGENYYLFSVHANKFVKADRTLVAGPADAIKFTDASSQGTGRVLVSFKYLNDKHINLGGDKQMIIDGWGDGANEIDAGNAVKFVEAGDFNPTAALAMLTTRVDATYTLIDQTGQTYEGNFVWNGTDGPAVTGVFAPTFENEVWDAENNHYTATINFGYPVSNERLGATNETLLAINGKYIRAVGDDVKVQTTNVAAVDANCLWAIYPEFSKGAFTFTIMNVATGKYMKTNATAGHNTKGTVVLSDEATVFTIGGDNEFKADNLYLSINSPANDTDVYLGLYGNTHGGTDIIDSALQMYQVKITAAKYATFYAPVAVTVPDGVTAHTVTIKGEWASLSEALDVIPAYTGVVLYSETAGTYTFDVTAEQVAPIENNALVGTVATTNIGFPAYVLGNINVAEKGQPEKWEVGFYTASMTNGAWKNNHHKAYLPMVQGQNSASLRFDFGTTAIEEVEVENAEAEVIFDLCGRRVNQITKAGVYIIGGHKVLVK